MSTKKTTRVVSADKMEFADAFQMFLGEVMLLNGEFMSAASERAADLDITPPQWQALILAAGQPRTVSQYARRLGTQRQNVQYTINSLVKRGLVELTDNPDHRRSPLIRLSSNGKKLLAKLRHRATDLSRQFTDGIDLTVEDLQRLGMELRQLRHQGRVRHKLG
ncbi:MAG: helix-turn-helix domain-containing protein [Gammaproteobacteria bacterium]